MIPILDLKAQYKSIKDEIDAAMAGVLESTQFILGPAVQELEQKVAAYCGCKYGVGLAFSVAAHRSTGGSAGSPCSSRRRLEPEILLVDEVLMVGDAAFHQKKCLGMEHERIAHGYPIERRKH